MVCDDKTASPHTCPNTTRTQGVSYRHRECNYRAEAAPVLVFDKLKQLLQRARRVVVEAHPEHGHTLGTSF